MNTGHLRNEGLSVPLYILFTLPRMSVPEQYAPPPLLSPPIELLLMLHDPTYMTPWGKTLWLPKFLVSSPVYSALLVVWFMCLLHPLSWESSGDEPIFYASLYPQGLAASTTAQ